MQHKYCSKTWLTRSICPSIWGWKVDDNSIFMLNSSKNLFQNLDAKSWGPWSEMISSRKPWYQNTWSRINLAILSPIIDLLHGMKWTMFVKQSTTTNMESNKLESGKSMMKSMEIEDHGVEGMGNGWRSSYGWWWRFFAQTQTAQDPTNSFTYFQSCGHQ